MASLPGHQNPYGGAPRIGNSAPGEPLNAPDSSQGVEASFGNGPMINDEIARGEDQVNRPGGGEVVPAAYGGGVTMFPRPATPSPHGNGAGPGAGALDGDAVP